MCVCVCVCVRARARVYGVYKAVRVCARERVCIHTPRQQTHTHVSTCQCLHIDERMYISANKEHVL